MAEKIKCSHPTSFIINAPVCLLSRTKLSLGVLREARKLYHGAFWGLGLETVGRLPLQDTRGPIFGIGAIDAAQR